MESFLWNKDFETGLTEVDQQHRRLVDILNHFGSLLVENTLNVYDAEVVLKELCCYADYHFKEEESLMRCEGIDARHFDDHLAAHQQFMEEVTALKRDFHENNTESAKHLLSFLNHWIVYHILGSDQNMARQIEAIQTGIDPIEAYDRMEKEAHNSTEPLLLALNGLFEQVTAMNKELRQVNLSLEQQVAKRTQELSDTNQRLQTLSITDPLTQLPNRRHAMQSLEILWQESITQRSPLVCMMIDIDHFKEVNDTYGHHAGDAVLIELANTLQHVFRTDDIICRLGGDELFVICPNTDLQGGLHVAELARQAASAMEVKTGDKPWQGTISLGVAARSADTEDFDALIKKADKGVYVAKKAGRNSVGSIT